MRVVIAEDGVLLREGLAHLLADEGHEVAASVGDALELVEVVERERPDVCIIDVRMPPTFTDEGLRERRSRSGRAGPTPQSSCSRSTWRSGTRSSCSRTKRAASATC